MRNCLLIRENSVGLKTGGTPVPISKTSYPPGRGSVYASAQSDLRLR